MKNSQRGIALVITMLVLMLVSALLVAFTTVVMTDQRYRFIDKDRGQVFYAAAGAIEKLTADLGNIYMKNVSLTNAQVTALTAAASQPAITGVTYTSASAPTPLPASDVSALHCNNSIDGIARTPTTVGTNGYTISFCGLNATTNPTTTPEAKNITSGAYEGLIALKTPYQLDVTARSTTGGEVHLVRTIEAVSIPVFQFGIFSNVDLGFNAGDAFSFGGRVHTNGNLFLAEAANNTLTLSDKVTAYGEVIRKFLTNGTAITVSGHTGTVNMAKAPGSYRVLATTEGSLVDGVGSAQNEPTWSTISLSTYKGYIKNSRTGAKQLNLPIITAGGTNTDLSRRAVAGEDTNSIVFQERLFTKASLRVLLSDTQADITAIPTIDLGTAPQSLEAGFGPFGGIPIATSPGPPAVAVGTPLTANTNSGPSVTLTMAAIPAELALPVTMTATSGANTWTITLCSTKTTTTFTGCTITQNGAAPANVPVGAILTAPGVIGVATTVLVASGANRTITVAANNTMGFSKNTFWIGDQLVTCSGLTATTLTGCALGSNVSNGDRIQNFAAMNAGTSLLGGFIKIERQNQNDSTWNDITAEILAWGIGAPSQSGSCSGTDPSPNAILRLQRYSDDAWAAPCLKTLITPGATDYWPNTLYDTRESVQRDAAPAGGNIKLNGVMHYVAIDAGNLAKWFRRQAPYGAGTGNQAKTDNAGYSIYISDRRNNRNAASVETAEYGWEDFVNPGSATGVPSTLLETGEDVNGNNALDVYGGVPNCNGAYNLVASGGITCSTFFTNASRPTDDVVTGAETFNGAGRAMVNRPILFRRAIKLINGSALGAVVTGLTVVTENPVYILGDWNANAAFNDPHAATAVIGDAVTLLSNSWVDTKSFTSPYAPAGRRRTANSYFRVAVLAGKGPIFTQPAGTGSTFGTDGGAHMFLRFLEGTGANPDTIHYKGSMATFYFNRQATGVFKGGGAVVYAIPANRDYSFDTDFLTPALLPPLTPVFRDMNAVGFSQDLRPGK